MIMAAGNISSEFKSHMVRIGFRCRLQTLFYFRNFLQLMLVSDQERKQALGEFTNHKEKQHYADLCKLFRPMNKPEAGDWLHSHKEVHQAYANYKLPNYNEVTEQRNTIYIQEFGKFSKEFIKEISDFCSAFYLTLKVKSLPPLDFQTELAGVKKRKGYNCQQFLAQDILAYMEKRVPKDAYCVMGITLKDIYPGENWNFVYGWAKYKARVGIFSFVRWDEQFFNGDKNAIDWKLIRYPSMRTMVHEIGHMFAVTHCVYNRCLMNGFNNIEQNYLNPLEFCPICYRKICKNIGFDKVQRHRRLIQICEESDVKELKKDQLLYEEMLKLDLVLGPEVRENKQEKPAKTALQTIAKPAQQPIYKPVQVGRTVGKSLAKPSNINGLIPLYKQVEKAEFDVKVVSKAPISDKPKAIQKPLEANKNQALKPKQFGFNANNRGKSTQIGARRN